MGFDGFLLIEVRISCRSLWCCIIGRNLGVTMIFFAFIWEVICWVFIVGLLFAFLGLGLSLTGSGFILGRGLFRRFLCVGRIFFGCLGDGFLRIGVGWKPLGKFWLGLVVWCPFFIFKIIISIIIINIYFLLFITVVSFLS